ncbi:MULTISPECIES: EF-hand domain-containing protein [unclassified Mesorhizobium]|uniref:EF-hand domain-containing protein n=1 Tax=unclassified Mesorhizobium TaxID=325217 RepID=UPI000FCCD3F1|nr:MULTISPECIES: EF-hand domain-containing protein [unclassified Mesorhizobium]TGP20223.1 signal transduction protein [Mesorhizobium sp. M1D.F.Ca.ET.231.01.1.1]TGP27700.1 signal transduction protein [Mesorhizobium sp. M1D.F.Ca.ET.234.01.1.1]TGS42050.1 signal transduction protein [Mesorhizobium sp. M1D.F.Ca.ET.184.01.1.1]TGS59402.1 signal transduction protein [Mesorhizobium sp. M1D.F.Ca.ET.183.01.1.1]
MRQSFLLAALLLGLAPLSSAQAQDAPRAQRFLQHVDTNGDGAVTKDEIMAARERMFKRLDRNGDGVIDENEIETARQAIDDRALAAEARLGNRWRRMDRNGDGKVSQDEFSTSTPLFDLVDRNGDGKLSADEIAAVRKLIADRAN